MRRGMFLALFIFILSLRVAGAAGSLGMSGKEQKKAPDFSLETVAGKTVALKDLNGQGAIMFFFTSWCPYCRQKLPLLSQEYPTYQKEDVRLVAVDAGESKAKVSSFATKEKLPFDVLLDIDMKVAEAYGVIGVPTFVLISKGGAVVYQGNELPRNYKELLAQ